MDRKVNKIRYTVPRCAMLDKLIRAASRFMLDLIVTPERALSGYGFAQAIGTAWIEERIPDILDIFAQVASEIGSAIVLGCPRMDSDTGRLHNAAIFYDERGHVAGFHDKLSVLPGSERWALGESGRKGRVCGLARQQD